jgi:uncharacterized integral membrane protein (TIGR00697 family)
MFDDSSQPSQSQLANRREFCFLILAGLFLGSLTMLNILGISRFIKLFESGGYVFALALGVLPYPITFLCTDLISELYGKNRARMVVWVGLGLNAWVIFILWLGGVMPGFEPMDSTTGLPVRDEAGRLPVFFEIRALTFGAVFASMIAYLSAQFVDVYVFHWLRRLTRGRHLWLRNNGSTLFSQLVDTVAVILITWFFTTGLDAVVDPEGILWKQLLTLILTGYVFKILAALIDTIPFYIATHYLRRYLALPDTPHSTDNG